VATARAEVAALRAMTIAGISRTARTGVPGPEGSIVRLFHGELHQRVYQLALDVIGPDALRLTPVDGDGVWTGPYLQSFAYTIGGGTTDIQRNIVGERVLGLPRA
jgi:alkylation response protein AidB-like acyl-CoA dehydrogenase